MRRNGLVTQNGVAEMGDDETLVCRQMVVVKLSGQRVVAEKLARKVCEGRRALVLTRVCFCV